MCGIAGIISRTPIDRIRPNLMAMVRSLAHRGPDGEGCAFEKFGDGNLALGHRRLSILDLSPRGNQPMVHPETGDVLVYNGEIYNFRALRQELAQSGESFQSDCDTEVLLRGINRWGTGMLDRIHGMFAFAFFNKRENSLLLARDPLGIKPLYIAASDDAFLFASEVRSLLDSNLIHRRLDRQGLASALAYGAVQLPLTIVEGVREFPPGHWQIINPDVLERGPAPPQKYWDFRKPTPISPADAVKLLRTTLDDAVHDHLISDVPLGVFLSSGIDSTVVTGLASRHVNQLRTFTVGFDEHADLSESALAEKTAAEFGVQHTKINVTGPTALTLCEDWLSQQDQPSLDGLNVYIISKVVREAGITVALSGQGGDELFCGYASFHDVPLMQKWLKRAAHMPASLRLLAAKIAGLPKSRFLRDKFCDLATSSTDILSLYLHRRRALSNRQLRMMGIGTRALGLTSNFLLAEAENAISLDPDDAIWNISQLESRFYMGNMLLRDGDSNSMSHGLEIRVPFLDRRVLDLASSLPGELRWPKGQPKKYLLRKAFSDVLRPELMQQRKRGFEIPVKRWMQGPLRNLAEHALDRLCAAGVVHPQGVNDVWQTFQREPESPMWSRAWLLVSLGMYIERHRLS